MKRPPGIAFRGEGGEGIVSALILLAGALIPLLFLVGLVGRVEQARLAVSQAAQAAVDAAVEAPDGDSAQTAAEEQVETEQTQTPAELTLELNGSFARDGLVQAVVTGEVPVGALPVLGDFGTITVQATASAPVGDYRSFDPAAS